MKNRIKELLAERVDPPFTQEQLARRVGVSIYTINRAANGHQVPTKRIQKRIANALGVGLEEVFPPPKRKTRVA